MNHGDHGGKALGIYGETMKNCTVNRRIAIIELKKLGIDLSSCPGNIGLARKILKLSGKKWPDKMKKKTAKRIVRNFASKSNADYYVVVTKKTEKKPILVKEFVKTNVFLQSYEWRKLRLIIIKKYGARCMCCGAKPPEVVINVDHIKPRKKYPELALDPDNLQVLCEPCNHGKGNWDETDFRPDKPETKLRLIK